MTVALECGEDGSIRVWAGVQYDARSEWLAAEGYDDQMHYVRKDLAAEPPPTVTFDAEEVRVLVIAALRGPPGPCGMVGAKGEPG